MFKSVTAKLGNMRKAQEWTVYPIKPSETTATIQCDQRIAKIDFTSGNCLLSDGKGGHQGFMKLSTFMGAKVYPTPTELLEALKNLVPES